jgi:hypothetical protein
MGATGRNALGQFTGGGGGDAKNLVIVLSHGVPYGIWLEVRFSGKYAIVTPAIPYWGPKVMTLAAQLAFEEGIANA